MDQNFKKISIINIIKRNRNKSIIVSFLNDESSSVARAIIKIVDEKINAYGMLDPK